MGKGWVVRFLGYGHAQGVVLPQFVLALPKYRYADPLIVVPAFRVVAFYDFRKSERDGVPQVVGVDMGIPAAKGLGEPLDVTVEVGPQDSDSLRIPEVSEYRQFLFAGLR